ncbi:TM2 domain-containing protein [Haloprofundus salinisoli]|uniref:TM2 domain-containing protein n=1 Tax=Haloprofundus salinisoli TaxID=2876193 RepID=UPI001CCE8791|nr:TM2 domain-containing protein [Haloprofundus salinisoli]
MAGDTDASTGTEAAATGESRTVYCRNCGERIDAEAELCPNCGVRQRPPPSAVDDRRLVAALLAILLGSFGAHRFYLGRTKTGLLYLLFFWTGIPGLVGIVEGALYLSKSREEFEARYVEREH